MFKTYLFASLLIFSGASVSHADKFVTTPKPPYYAVIFSIQMSDKDTGAFRIAEKRMLEIASQNPGFVGVEGLADNEGFSLFIAYWKDLESMKAFKLDKEHMVAREKGRTVWFKKHVIRVAKIIKEYGGET